MDNEQQRQTVASSHRSGRWAGAMMLVIIMAVSVLVGHMCGSPVAEQSDTAGADSLNVAMRRSLIKVDSLLQAGDRDPENCDIMYVEARIELAHADSLAAAGAADTVAVELRRRADTALNVATIALDARRELYADMPRLADDLGRRAARVDSVKALYGDRKSVV